MLMTLRSIAFPCLLCVFVLATAGFCQSAQPELPSAQQPAPGPSTPGGPPLLVAVEVEIIELAALEPPLDIDPTKADAELLARVRELSRTGALRMSSKMRVTAVDGKPATVQFGEQALVPTSRVIRDGGGARIPAPVSLSRQSLGTLVVVTPTVTGSGAIVVEYQVEKSYLSQPQHKMKEADDVDAELPAPRPQTITAKSTASVPEGKTIILGGVSSKTSDGESSQVILLMSARKVQ